MPTSFWLRCLQGNSYWVIKLSLVFIFVLVHAVARRVYKSAFLSFWIVEPVKMMNLGFLGVRHLQASVTDLVFTHDVIKRTLPCSPLGGRLLQGDVTTRFSNVLRLLWSWICLIRIGCFKLLNICVRLGSKLYVTVFFFEDSWMV